MKTYLKNIFLFLLILFVINHVIVWFYEAPKRDAINNNTYAEKLKWDAIHDSKEKYDLVILGSSRVYNAYNPKVIDSVLNINSVNMGTGSQNIIESYYLLKEIFDSQQPKVIVFDLFSRSVEYSNPDYSHILSNADFLSTKNKLDLIVNGFGTDGIMNYLFPLLKYKIYFENYSSSESGNSPKVKWYKGYSEVTSVIDSKTIDDLIPTTKFKQRDKAIETIDFYLTKIRDLCKEKNAKLICIRTPYPPKRLEKDVLGDQNLSMLFDSIGTNLKVPFYDLNYLPNQYSNYDFFDFHHMNLSGSLKASLMLSSIISKE
ncbi:MAG: hypothetical protein JXR05_09425 [Flavobacteriaceae bacterium]